MRALRIFLIFCIPLLFAVSSFAGSTTLYTSGTLYSNGSVNGNIQDWNVCCGNVVTDSFTVTGTSGEIAGGPAIFPEKLKRNVSGALMLVCKTSCCFCRLK